MTTESPIKKSSSSPDNTGDRLMDLFGQAEQLPSLGEWRVRFETIVQTVMRVRKLPRPAAEKAAYQNVIVEFLNDSMPSNCDPNTCLWCRRVEDPAAPLIPLGIGRQTAWLHRDPCSDLWRDHRRIEAIAKLASMGIVAPAEDLQPGVKP
jgi:hypothetical protein